jgi:hypothetical protein
MHSPRSNTTVLEKEDLQLKLFLPGLYAWIGKLGTTLIVWNDDVTYEEVEQPEVYSSH